MAEADHSPIERVPHRVTNPRCIPSARHYDEEFFRLEPVRSYASDDPDRLAFEFDLLGVDRAAGQRFESSLVELWTFAGGRVRTIKPHYFNVPQRP
jgi:hypothetical protein